MIKRHYITVLMLLIIVSSTIVYGESITIGANDGLGQVQKPSSVIRPVANIVSIMPVASNGAAQAVTTPGSDERNFVARVIFAEAGPFCSDNERELVASVMVGRISRPGFDNGDLDNNWST